MEKHRKIKKGQRTVKTWRIKVGKPNEKKGNEIRRDKTANKRKVKKWESL